MGARLRGVLAARSPEVERALDVARVDRFVTWALWGQFAVLVAVEVARTLLLPARPLLAPAAALVVAYLAALGPALLRPADGRGAWRFLAAGALAVQSLALLTIADGAGIAHAFALVSILAAALWADWRVPVFVAAVHILHHAIAFPLAGPALFPASPDRGLGFALDLVALTGTAIVAGLAAESTQAAIRSVAVAQRRMQDERDTHATLLRQIEEERERLRVVLGSIPAGVVLAVPAPEAPLDPEPYRVVLANDGLARLIRHPFKTGGRLAQYASFAGYRPDGSAYGGREWPIARSLIEGEVVAGEEIRLQRADGSQASVIAHSAPVRDPTGRVTAAVMVLLDVTERKEAERAVATSRRAAEEREKVSGLAALVGGVAHEVRTPLTYIQNNLELVRVRLRRESDKNVAIEPLARDVDRLVREATDGVDRITRLVSNLRQVTRVEPGPRVAESLDRSVAAAIDLFAATHRATVTLETDLRPSAPVLVDRAQIQQVVLNLLANASEAMPRGGRIRVTTGDVDGWAVLTVEDEGPGIPVENRQRLFAPFFTTKEEGMGLGLSISRGIVEAHGGTIDFQTVLAQGTVFRVRLPPAAPQQAAASAPRPRLRISGR